MAASPWPGWLPLTAGLLLLVGTASALQGVQAEQADFPGLQQPSASECRAHIEAALKELSTTKTEEGASGSAEGSEEVPGGSTQSDEITSQEGEQTAPDESIEQESREASEGKDVDLSEEAASTASQEEPPISGESEEISDATADSKELPAGSDEDASGDNISNEQEGRDSDEAGGSSRTSDEDQKTSAGSAEDESTEIPETSAEDGESRQVDSVEDGESREEPTASDEEGAASVEGESKEETQVSTEGSVEAPEASAEDSQAEASDEVKSREARDVSGDGSQEATAASAEDSDSQETEEASGEEGESREPPAESADGSESREAPAESAEDGESREFPAGSAEEGESGEAPAQSAEGSESGEALAESTEGSESKETPAESGEEGESREAPVESAEDGDSKETPTESAEGESKEAEVSGEGDSKEATGVSEEEGESRETREVSVEEGASKEASGEDGESKEVQQVSGEEGESREGSGEEGESKEASGVDGDSKEASGEGESTEAPVSGEEGESAEATPASGEGESQEAPEVSGESKEVSGEGESKEGPPASEEEGASKEDVTHEEKSAEESDETLVPAESKESAEKMAGESVEDTDKESTEQGSKERIVPEEDLAQEIPIPSDRRPRSHISEILQLQELAENDLIIQKMIDSTLKDLKKIYDNAIKPLEVLYKYRDLSNRHYGDPEIFSKPLILFMGPWSGGKSTIINYLMDLEFTKLALRTGAEPSPAYFNILMWGEREEVLDGTQLAADWTFSGLQKFGQGLLDRLRGLHLPNRLLEKVNIVEIPGILEIRKQVERLFPFNDACQWFIDRADIIFLVYDPSKLDVGPETEAILDQLKGRESQVRIILNKADQVKPEELMRVQGTLIWNISPLMSSSEPPVMYSTSLWSVPYEIGAPIRLLNAQEQAFLKDIRKAIDKRVDNKIASARRFAVRVRNHAKMVDCYLTTYYNHKTFFGNKKKITEDIIEHPQNYHIYEGLSTLTNISRYDLPDPEIYRDFFKLNPLYDFQQLSATCTYFRGCPINQLDIAIAYELPELVGKYKKSVEEALAHMAASRKS